MKNSVTGFKIKKVALHEKACAQPTKTCAHVKQTIKRQWGQDGVDVRKIKCMFKIIRFNVCPSTFALLIINDIFLQMIWTIITACNYLSFFDILCNPFKKFLNWNTMYYTIWRIVATGMTKNIAFLNCRINNFYQLLSSGELELCWGNGTCFNSAL